MKLKHLFLVLLAQMFSMTAFAYDAEIDGIYYNFSETGATVTYQEYTNYQHKSDYSGDIVIPETVSYNEITYSVTSIASYAFYGCSGLTSVTIPESVTSIGKGVFDGCSGLTSVTIPNSVTSVGGYAFEDTPWYNNQPDGLIYVGKVAHVYKGTMPDNTTITIKNGTISIGESAFNSSSNRGLISVNIPNSVICIGEEAFQNCSGLTSIILPKDMTTIGKEAFKCCYGLTSVVAEMTTPFAFGSSAFDEISSYCVLTVPKGTRDAYIAAGWTEEVFKGGIVEKEGEDNPIEDKTHVIVMERKYMVHHANDYVETYFTLYFDNNKYLRVGYFNTSFWDGAYCYDSPFAGVHLMSGEENEGYNDDWNIAPVIVDEWVKEKLIVKSDGHVQYWMNDQYMGEKLFDKLDLLNTTNVVVDFQPWGWGTGHYQYMDDFKFSTPMKSISDNFDDGVFDTDIWQSPVNPDGVREEDGIMKMEQIRTDENFHLRSLPIPINDDDKPKESGAYFAEIPASVVPDGYTAATYSYVLDGVTYNSIDELNAAVAMMASESTHAVQVKVTGDATDGTKTVVPGDVFKFTIPADGGEIDIPSACIPKLPSLVGWEIVMERKYLQHHGCEYNEPQVALQFNNDKTLDIAYYDTEFWCDWDHSIHGIHILTGEDLGKPDRYENYWYISPTIQDEWVTEKLIVKSDGHVQYWMNDQYMGEKLFDNLDLQNATSVVVSVNPNGWWTGHYHYMDDFKISTSMKSISDNFDDGVIDTDIWQSPVNPDGVREEDGIMKMEQLRTDQDFYLRSLPIPLKSSGDDDDLDVADANIQAGESNIVEIGLTNGHTGLVAFQMDLTLPEGVSIDKTGCALSSRIADEEQTLTIGKLESGAYRITSTSFSLTPISGNDGTLFSLKLTAEDGCIGGQATINNVIFSTLESEKVIMSDKAFDISILYNLTYTVEGIESQTSSVAYGSALTPEAEPTMEGYTFGGWSELPATMPNHDVEVTGRFYLYGDVNTDEAVDVVDVVDIARFVVATPSVNFREKLADLNYDSTINIADAVTLVNYIAGDQNFVKAEKNNSSFYDYSQCQLQLLSGEDYLSIRLSGEADFTAFQFEVEVPENTNISAMRINGMRNNGHKLLFNKVAENRYRVAAISLTNATFKGEEGELLNICIEGLQTDDACIHGIHFVTTKGLDITFDSLYVSGIETGIVNVDNNGNNPIYDLQGRRRSTLQHGLNIVGGKTILNK